MRRILLTLAVVLAVLAPGAPAWAHTRLVAADPAAASTLAAAPTAVTLEFSQELNPDFTTVVVSDAARHRIPSSAAAIDGVHSAVTLDQPLGNGVYTVAYRVVSVDGHTVQGSYAFTVADPKLPAAPVLAPSSAAPAAAGRSDGSGGIPTGVLIGLAVAGLFLAAIAAYLYRSGRRRGRAVPDSSALTSDDGVRSVSASHAADDRGESRTAGSGP